MATLQDLAIRILIKQDAIKKDLDKVKRSFETAWDGVKKSAAVAGAAAGAAMMVGLTGALDAKEAQAKLEASLGQADVAEQAGRIAGDLYAKGWGESMGDVIAAAGTVHSSLASAMDGTDETLAHLTERALAFAKAFDVDVSEAARNAGILLETGLAKDAEEAFDLMVAAMQKVPAALRGEVMDATEEYSQFFAALGLTGAESLGMLGEAARYAGKYGIDKMGDAIKEFTIRATDMSSSTVEAFQTIGLDAQTMAERLLAGGDTARQAFGEIVAGLRGIEDPVLQSNTSIALFGTMLEDLGTAQVPEFLASLDPANSKLMEVAGAADQMTGALEDGVSPLESLKREAQTALVDVMEDAAPHLQSVVSFLREHKALVGPLVIALGAFAAIIGTIIAITKIWTAVQIALNIAMSLNPVGLIVIAIIALIAIIVLLWTKCEGFRNFFIKAWEWIKEAAFAVGRWFRDVLWEKWIKGAWDAILGAAQDVWQWMKDLPGKLKDAFINLVNIITTPWRTAFNWISDAWNNTVGKLSWTVPSWVPGLGGKTISAPKLPKLQAFHNGGVVPGRGEQLALVEGGEAVFTRDQLRAMGQRGEPTTLVIQSDGSRGSLAIAQLFAEFLQGQGLQVVTR